MDLADFFHAANRATSPAELTQVWLNYLSTFGIERFLMSELGRRPEQGASKIDLLCNYPSQWFTHYQAMKYENADPVVRLGLESAQPFSWASAEARFNDRQARRVMGEARDFGLRNGVALSFRQSGGKLIGIGFASPHQDIRDDPVSLRILDAASFEFYSCYAKFVGELGRLGQDGVRQKLLTDREREVLLWIAAGKTKSEVGDILGISDSCVKRHCESIFRKLEARTLAQAVARAIGLGVIDAPS